MGGVANEQDRRFHPRSVGDPACWHSFRTPFETRGYRCLAPAWPYDDRSVEELRRSPAPELAGVGVTEIVDHYASIIAGLDESPVIVGHSFGGLFVQMLLNRAVGTAGVAIDSAPPKSVVPGFSSIRAGFPVVRSWRGWKRVLEISAEHSRGGSRITSPRPYSARPTSGT